MYYIEATSRISPSYFKTTLLSVNPESEQHCSNFILALSKKDLFFAKSLYLVRTRIKEIRNRRFYSYLDVYINIRFIIH